MGKSLMSAWVLLAEGFEEVEAITPIDFLRRAGIDVTAVAIGTQKMVTGSHGIGVMADALLKTLEGDPDAVLLPGGMPGAANLGASQLVTDLLGRMVAANKLVAAICAAPAMVLGTGGFIEGRNFTCYPGYEDRVKQATFSTDRVVRDGNMITSRGPGSAAEFACAIIEHLLDRQTAARVWKETLQAQSVSA